MRCQYQSSMTVHHGWNSYVNGTGFRFLMTRILTLNLSMRIACCTPTIHLGWMSKILYEFVAEVCLQISGILTLT
jgi:hypothetical protein